MSFEPETFEHRPVMVDQIVELFAAVPGGFLLDATVGAGGHAAALLDAHEQLRLLGIDQDPDALVAAGAALARFGPRALLEHGRFDRLAEIVRQREAQPVSGVLFDLGVSSPQVDRASRGFSYRHEGPLDMRMDPSRARTADDVVNQTPEDELAEILHEYGDERFARRIARAIVANRPVRSTAELADIVAGAVPAPARRRGGNPAKRTFQAIRIDVNDELRLLAPSLDAAVDLLAPGGRIAVLSYHSGEDRIAKQRLRTAATGGCTCPPRLPCGCGARPTLRLLRSRSTRPDPAELESNPRSASARLRAGEKLPVEQAA